MKKITKIICLMIVMVLITACSRSVERADRVITKTQESVNSLISNISEMQHLENQLQEEFESMIQSEAELEAFNDDNAPVYMNIKQRREIIESIKKSLNTFEGLREEMQSQIQKTDIDTQYLTEIHQLMTPLEENLTVYINEYQDNLILEEANYRALANPTTDYSNFFKFFDNITIITANNQMNLEKAIAYFEPINAKLIDFKVYLANLGE